MKSFTVFFSPAEVKVISERIKYDNGGITNFIKQATLSAIDKPCADIKVIGQVHEAMGFYYSLMRELCESHGLDGRLRDQILIQVESLEKSILGFVGWPPK